MSEFQLRDSGERQQFDSGMVRDIQDGKILYHLVASGPMLKRWAIHLTAGAKKYTEDNWMLASGDEELKRFRASAFRHFMQWYNGERDEDHAAATFFNVNGVEYVLQQNKPSAADGGKISLSQPIHKASAQITKGKPKTLGGPKSRSNSLKGTPGVVPKGQACTWD
jgi:hypothetical protein